MWHGSKAVRLGLGQDGWGSLLTQMAGANAKHWAKPYTFRSFFFDIVFFIIMMHWVANGGGNERKMGGEW